MKSVELIADGWECDVWSFLFEPELRTAALPLILRIYRGSGAVEKSNREIRALRYLKTAGFPVPAVFAHGPQMSQFDQPFMIMEKITGEPLGATMRRAQPVQLNQLVDLFCSLALKLHRLHPHHDGPDSLTVTTIDEWLRAARGTTQDFDLPEFLPALEWLSDHRPTESDYVSLIHGDFHPGNILLDETGQPFVIDWTSTHRADSRFDLAWTLLLIGSSVGEDTRLTVLRSYERQAGASVVDFEFFEVAACARRLADILVSLRDGPESMGMRLKAAAMMANQGHHIATAASLLEKRTGIRIPSAERLLTSRVGQ